MKIAVASRSFSRNPILRDELVSRFGFAKFNETGKVLSSEELVNFAKGFTHLITGLEKINDTVLKNLPDLEVVSKYGVGLDMIDLQALQKHNVKLGWISGVNAKSVAELTVMHMIAALRNVSEGQSRMRSGLWGASEGRLLSGRTVGIWGCGHIGKEVIKLLQVFGCEILVNDLVHYEDFYKTYNIKTVSLEELLKNSDVVSIHVPLTSLTRNRLDDGMLGLMKPNGILINTARGQIVDEKALAKRLQAQKLSAAAFDVFADEPHPHSELLESPRFFATPHIGANAQEAVLAMGRAAIRGLEFPLEALSFI